MFKCEGGREDEEARRCWLGSAAVPESVQLNLTGLVAGVEVSQRWHVFEIKSLLN